MKGERIDAETVGLRNTASMIDSRWHMSREEKNEVLPLGAHRVSPAGHLCSLPGSHQHARSPETPSSSTTLYKAGQANKNQIRPKFPSTIRSGGNGRGSNEKKKRAIEEHGGVIWIASIHHLHPNQAAICGHRSRMVPGPSSSATLKVLPPPHASGLSAEA